MEYSAKRKRPKASQAKAGGEPHGNNWKRALDPVKYDVGGSFEKTQGVERFKSEESGTGKKS